MALKDLAKWLSTTRGFRERYICLVLDHVSEQFGDSIIREQTKKPEHEWSYLLTCASLLAVSEDQNCQEAALRIAQAALQQPQVADEKRLSAALILDALTNDPSIRLAEARGWIPHEFENKLPLAAYIDCMRRRLEYSIEILETKRIRVNRFQRDLWNAALRCPQLSVSAPTSAGKSFIIGSWLAHVIGENRPRLLVYLVPTRALVTQVEADLRRLFKKFEIEGVNVASIPLPQYFLTDHTNVFVFTQERLHIFLSAFESCPCVEVLIVDEAQKIGDQHRGVLLEQVILRVQEQSKDSRIVYASPLTENPEELLDNFAHSAVQQPGSPGTLVSQDVTVSQNLIWINQAPRRPTHWTLSLCRDDEVHDLGDLTLPHSPNSDRKRLAFVAVELTRNLSGTVIYVNGADEAEKTANLIFDCLPPLPQNIDSSLEALIDLTKKAVHEKFQLAETLKKGVAFHYGNMPLLLKTEIENLFSQGHIRYLVCTSTLVEGVNMACRTIVTRGPRKGSKPMSADDFWNLAGRAGRLGKEFQGNVVCIDANKPHLWKDGTPPRVRERFRIERTTNKVLGRSQDLVDFIDNGTPRNVASSQPDLEYTYAFLVSTVIRGRLIEQLPMMRRLGMDARNRLAQAVHQSLSGLDIPTHIIERNPGISPLAMKALLERFNKPDRDPASLILPHPSSDDAVDAYTSAFVRIAQCLNLRMGYSSKHSAMLALTVVRWMTGRPLSRLIQDRIDYYRRKNMPINVAKLIREVMSQVETIARFEAPKSVACYNDLLRHYLIEKERPDLVPQVEDVSVFLEFGVNAKTQLALMSLGLSRTSTILVSGVIADDALDEARCLQWLQSNGWMLEDFPRLVQIEIQQLLHNRTEGT